MNNKREEINLDAMAREFVEKYNDITLEVKCFEERMWDYYYMHQALEREAERQGLDLDTVIDKYLPLDLPLDSMYRIWEVITDEIDKWYEG